MDCVAWSRAGPAIKATTAADRATAMPPIIRERCGAGCWDLLCWRIFGFMATKRKRRGSWSRWGSPFTCTASAPSAKSSKATLRSHPTDASRKLGRWEKFSAPCRRFREIADRESRLVPDSFAFVQFDQHFAGAQRWHQEEINARRVGSRAGLRID